VCDTVGATLKAQPTGETRGCEAAASFCVRGCGVWAGGSDSTRVCFWAPQETLGSSGGPRRACWGG
jgi:hypothetical protein